ncbi:hypothetical protein [Fimbriiglobus ruber]|uniref:Uncharacterized protein n=1 Tax=Fimbriiglobus ruber TaxID=1908690 RepID=A0A225DMV4_9BACT|nr:hypothetical protein [Fimbriiglobus ruber]OWK38569.1 hypothetical protein FRUB_07689 [Fimbriiglobus ruber]
MTTSNRAADVRQRTTWGNRFRFCARVLGLTGALAAPVGWVLAGEPAPTLTAWVTGSPPPVAAWGQELIGWVGSLGERVADGGPMDAAHVGVILLLVGGAVVLLALLEELLGGLFRVTGRKTAVNTNAAVQMALAAILLVVVNAVSLTTFKRYDLTRDHQFTLAPDLVSELKKLRSDSPTTIVVLQKHKTAGTLSNDPDAYDYAAERKVIDKVEDLVDQLRELGPRFNVVVLDVQDEGYERAVKQLTRTRPGLSDAIRTAPENSIFFYADGKVRRTPRTEADQLATAVGARPSIAADPDDAGSALVYPGAVTRLSFTEFYQLDKTSSREATPTEREALAPLAGGPAFAPGVLGKGNLVLLPRGRESFVRKVLALEDRKPRVALAVIHPLLTSRENFDIYSAAGLRKSLEENGFEVQDVILKRWNPRGGMPTAAVDTYEENELERAESRYNLLTTLAANREQGIKQLSEAKVVVDKALAARASAKTDAEKATQLANAIRVLQRFVRSKIQTEVQVGVVVTSLTQTLDAFREDYIEISKQLVEATTRYRDVLRNERAVENRRIVDLKVKLKQYVDDCDILIVPRLTVMDIARGEIIPPQAFNLSKEQAEVIKEFVKAGKPVLFAVGPTNVDRRGPIGETAGDDVEKLLAQFGIELGRQTIITDLEGQAMAERQNEALVTSVDVPALVFDMPEKEGKAANPVTAAFRVTARAVDRTLDVRKSGYRPVYLIPGAAAHLPFAAEIAYTVRESWNEEKPIAEEDYIPKFEPSKPDDPKRGTHDEERRGPFPIGVAIESPVPVQWFSTPAPADKGAAGPKPDFDALFNTAALSLSHDGGLFAACVTLTAQQVKRPTVRIVALGHGGLFNGKQLAPANETLLLHSVNWQLKRDDRLPKDVPDDEKWRFPRVELSPRAFGEWSLATLLGLPALTIYCGLIALMVRRIR